MSEWNVTWQGRESHQSGTQLRWDAPTDRACVFPDYMRGTKAAGTTDSWAATPGRTSISAVQWKVMHGYQDVSVKCAHLLHSVTLSHRPSFRGTQPARLRCVSNNNLSLLYFPPLVEKILLGKKKHKYKFCWPNRACAKAVKNKRENSKSTRNTSLERKKGPVSQTYSQGWLTSKAPELTSIQPQFVGLDVGRSLFPTPFLTQVSLSVMLQVSGGEGRQGSLCSFSHGLPIH